jgi:hypothetical protein
MGFRFRKYFSVIPGIRVNLGKKGISVSIGGNGITTNISKNGTRNTVSIFGSGLSYSSYLKHPVKAPYKDISPFILYVLMFSILAIMVFAGTLIAIVIF